MDIVDVRQSQHKSRVVGIKVNAAMRVPALEFPDCGGAKQDITQSLRSQKMNLFSTPWLEH
jgi:hypothetical protein